MQQNINGVDSCYFGDGGTGSALAFPPWNSPRAFNPAQYEPNSFMVPPPPVGLFNPRRQFGYESGSPYDHNIRLTTESLGGHVDHYSIGSAPFDDQLHAELHNKMEIMEAKALAARAGPVTTRA
ncbi:hypothetical protein CASFOL_024298 [Castilleja foliolosa]|uniref:Uncharacterized protein n=1 Tax=Castilleja foliolosa TaxID=1961234 RepID=A0ABD3CQ08_9LAMI